MPLDTQRIRALCFDVDGTLSDTDNQYVEKLARILRPLRFLFGKKNAGYVARRFIMAMEAPANLIISLPDVIGIDASLMALADFINRMYKARPKKYILVPGVKEMLEVLYKSYPMCVVSARDERTTNNFLNQFHLLPLFKCVATAQTCEHTKPYPDPILWAAREMGVPAQACLMIGDTTVDIRAGRSAGTQTAGVLCGFGEKKELQRHGADIILKTTADLLPILI